MSANSGKGPHLPESRAIAATATLLICVLFTAGAGNLQAQCGTPGVDGSPNISGIVNTYYPGTTAGAAAGTTSIPVGPLDGRGSATAIATGDLLLVVQIQDASIDVSNTGSYGDGNAGDPATGATGGTAGLYEYVVATGAISGGAVPITGAGSGNGLINSYVFAAPSATHGQTRYQVIRVPQYANPTLTGNLTSPTWNGTTGGVVAIDVDGVLNLGGFSINVAGRGFRGGEGRGLGGAAGILATDYRSLSSLNAFGSKGEGIAGTPEFTYNSIDLGVDNGAGVGYPDGASAIASSGRGAPANAGGGGNDAHPSGNDQNTGGGGGGNGGVGGHGGRSWNSVLDLGGFGGSFASPSSGRIVMGGGGGAGARNNSSGVMSSGGAGGGIVIVRAGSITGNGSINADGAFGVEPSNDGGGGGGAGGSVIVVSPAALPATLGISAHGANGTNAFAASAPGTAGEFTVGSANNRHGPGGGGGGGVIFLSGSGPSLNLGGGSGGTTTTVANGFGATPGGPGISGTISWTSIPGTPAGASCSADVSVIKTGPASFTPGTNGTYTIQVTNSGPASASAVSLADPTPPGLIFVSASAPCGGGFPCALGTLVSSATVSVTVTFQIPAGYAGAGITNTATVSSTTPDPSSTNNISTVVTPSATSANLKVTKVGPGTIAAGTSGSFTITITNNGPSNATGVSLSDPTPAGLTFVSATAPCAGGVSPCAIGTINAGNSVTITVTYSVPAAYAGPSPFTNTATVTSTTPDPDPSDDTTSVVTIVGAPQADLAVKKTGPSFAIAGSQVTYTLTVKNNGPSPANAVSLTDPAPAGLSFTSMSGACIGTFPCSLGTMAAGATATVTAVYSIPPGYNGVSPFVNTATVSSTTTDPNNANNSSSVSTTVSASADLQVTKTGPASVNPGNQVTYTITVLNNGPSHATSVYLDDPLPPGTGFVSATAPCAAGFFSPCSLGTINAGSSVTITVVLNVPGGYVGSSLTNTATATTSTPDPNTSNNTSSATTAVGTADLQVTKSGPASITPGQQITYTIAVLNNGPSAAAGVVLSDPTPAGLTFVSASAPCGGGFPCTIGAISSGATTTITAVYQVPPSYSGANPITNTASVTSTSVDPNSGNDTSTKTISVLPASADLAVTKSGPASINPGQQITYTIAVTNNGPSDATGVSLADPTPTGLTFVSASAPCASFPCALGTILSGSTSTITAVFQVPPTYAGPNPIINTATTTATTTDPNSGNDQSSVSTSVVSADLAVTKTIAPTATPLVGSSITYTVTIRNNGPSTATNVAVTDNVPAGLTSVIATPSGATTYNGGTGVWTVGTLTNGATATLTIQATVSARGTVVNTATITASDQADPNSANNTASVSYTTLNTPPVAVNDSYSTAEDVALNVAAPGVKVNDSDVDGDPLTAILVTGPIHGTLTLNSNGSFVYTPNANYNGPDSFTYKVNDGIADSNVATVNLTVTPVNDPPVAVDDAYITAEDTPITVAAPGVLINDTDIDSPVITAILVGSPSNGSVTLNANGSFTYTPNANFNGTDTFTYKANDGALDSNVATVTITITPVNDPPIAVNDSYTTLENIPLTIGAPGVLSNDTDVDGDPLTVTLVGGPANGTVTLNPNGSFTYTPNLNYNGTDTFTYKANDGSLDSNVATVTISITPVNQPPVAVNDAYTTPEDTALSIAAPGVLANDSDPEGNSGLFVILVGAPTHGTVTLNPNGSFTYTPNANFNGVDTFTYKANDGALDSNVATVTITVTPVNDPPVAVNDAYTTAEDTPLTIAAPGVLSNDTDIDSPVITAILAGPPSNGTVTLNPNGSFIYTPNANFNGTDTFTYRANDGALNSNVATVTITITPVNDPPVAVNDAYATPRNTPLTIVAPGVLANDTDVDSPVLTVTLVGSPTNGTVTLNPNGSFTYTPNANYVGTDTFTYKANDGSLDSNSATVTITITAVNSPPVAVNDAYTTPKNTPLTIAAPGVLVNDSDVDGNPITAIIVGATSNGTVTLNANGSFSYTPNANYTGTDTFTYKANDGSLDSNIATVTITITAVNSPPFAVNDAYTTAEDTPLTIAAPGVLVNDNDPDGDPMTVALVGAPTNGTVTLNPNGSFLYTPNANYNGIDTFTYRANDGTANSNVATVTITITPVNDPPIAIDDSYATAQDTPLFVAAPGVMTNDSDPDGDPITVTTSTTPAHGTVAVNPDGSFTYTPTAGYSGTDTFTYTITDGRGGLATAVVHLNVTPSGSVQPILVARKTAALATDADGNGVVSPGDTIRYTIVITNTGTVPATSVVITDTPGSNTTLIAGSVTTSTGVIASGNGAADKSLTVNIGGLAPAASVTVTFLARIASTLPPGVTSVRNQGTANSDQTTRNTDDPSTPVVGDPTVTPVVVPISNVTDLSISKSVDQVRPLEGGAVTYTVTVINRGNVDMSGVTATDLLPAGTSFVSALTATGTYDGATGVWQIGTLTIGSSATLMIRANVGVGTAGSTITNCATLNTSDSNPANDQACIAITPATPRTASCGNHAPVISAPMLQAIEAGATLRFFVAAIDPDGDSVSLRAENVPTHAHFDVLRSEFVFSPADLCDLEDEVYVPTFIATDSHGAETSIDVPITVGRHYRPRMRSENRHDQVTTAPIISIPAGPIGAEAGAPIQFKVVAESAIDLCTTTITLPDSSAGFFDLTSNVFTASAAAPSAAQIRLVTFTATDCKGNRAVATVPLRTGSQSANRISAVQRVVFETTPLGAQYATTTISITNNGAQPLGIQSVRFDDGRSFLVDGALRLPVVLAPSHELPLRVSFVPQQTGTITDRLLIATDDPSQRMVSIDVQGVGGAADHTVSSQSSAQSLILPYIDRGPILTPGPVSWGSVAGCANHPPVLSVPSLLAVEVGKRIRFTIAAVDPDGDAVSLGVASLPPGAAFNPLTGIFTFVPQEACDDSAEREYVITFVAVDSFGASTSAPVRITTSAAGSGLDSTVPIISVPQGRLTIDDSQPMHVRVVADAGDNCPVTLTRMDSSGGSFDVANGELILGAPAGSGTSLFTIRATSCNGVTSSASVPVDVRTSAPFAISAAQSVEFAPVVTGSTNGYVIVPIVNRTGLPLPITSVTLAHGTDFRIDGVLRLPLMLDPGQELPVRIEFQPTRAGQLTDELLIARSDSPTPSLRVSLSGQTAN